MMVADGLSHPLNGSWSVGWFTLSLINAGLAQSKGRSRLVWWLLSLAMGPIATLLVVVLPTVEKTGEFDDLDGFDDLDEPEVDGSR